MVYIFLQTFPSGEGNGNPLHCSCLENSMDEEPGAWRITVHGSQRVRHDLVTHIHIHTISLRAGCIYYFSFILIILLYFWFHFKIYNWPLNNTGCRGADSCADENPYMILQLAFSKCGSALTDSTNCVDCVVL